MIISYEDGIVKSLDVVGGCPGNLKGISRLVKGMKLEDVRNALAGTTCGSKNTSCPDQLSKAIDKILAEKNN